MFGGLYFGAYGFGALPSGSAPVVVAAATAHRGKYKPEHTDAHQTIVELPSLQEDHAFARDFVGEAGV